MLDDGYSDLSNHDSFADGVPHKTFDRLRRDDPVSWTEGNGTAKGFWNLTRHADILQANKDYKSFSSGQGIRIEDQSHEEYMARRTFQETDPPEHSATRRAVNPLFAKQVVANFEELITQLAADIVDAALKKNEFDVVEEIAKQLPMLMLGRILGVPDKDLPWLVDKGDALIGNSDPDFTTHVVDQMDTEAYRLMPFRNPAGADLYAYAAEILSGHKRVGQDGILARMMQTQDMLDPLAFKNFFCLLVAAGNDTTRYSIAMAFHLLTQNPALVTQLKTGRYWDAVADEVIRLASPTMHFRRTAIQDCELHGKKILKGDKVLLWFISGSRDETVFKDPHTARLDRGANRHLAFGQGGVHVCLGMHLARLEVRIALEQFIKRIDTVEAIEAPNWTRSNFICGVKKLNLRVKVL